MGVRARRSVLVLVAVWLGVGASSAAAADRDVGTEGVVAQPATTDATGDLVRTSDEAPATGVEVDPAKPLRLPPVIHCTWVLPDMGPDPADGHQYDRDGLADDLPEPTVVAPCDLGDGVAPTLVAPAANLAQVLPNGADRPGPRRVEIWTAVSHAAGPAQVDGVAVAVRDPDGNTLVPSGTTAVVVPGPGTCADLDAPLDAAVRSGQLTQAAATSAWGMAGLCADGWLHVTRHVVAIPVAAPCGAYAIDVTATSGEEEATLSVGFEVLCFHELAADFDAVDWRDLVGGAVSVAAGDTDPNTPDRPTVENVGNTPLVVGLTFRPLCLTTDPDVCIGEFGAELQVAASAGRSRIEPAPPGTELTGPPDDANAVVCPGERARLDLLAATPPGVAAGRYAGSVRIVGIGTGAPCPRASDTAGATTTTDPVATSSTATGTTTGTTSTSPTTASDGVTASGPAEDPAAVPGTPP
jgi:hypothetical protein